jgi:hypothetical protein
VSELSLVPVPAGQSESNCANCGAALAADQRYCLSCGQPASPVRLAFLDVLESRGAAAVAAGQPPLELAPGAYATAAYGGGANGWLRRNTGLLALLGVLVLCLIVGLLVGHWVSQGDKTPAKQVVEVKGLSGLGAPAAAITAPSAAVGSSAGEATQSAKEAAAAKKAEANETKAEKAPPPKPVKVAPPKIKKLTHSTGAQHHKEIDELGAAPIETG